MNFLRIEVWVSSIYPRSFSFIGLLATEIYYQTGTTGNTHRQTETVPLPIYLIGSSNNQNVPHTLCSVHNKTREVNKFDNLMRHESLPLQWLGWTTLLKVLQTSLCANFTKCLNLTKCRKNLGTFMQHLMRFYCISNKKYWNMALKNKLETE